MQSKSKQPRIGAPMHNVSEKQTRIERIEFIREYHGIRSSQDLKRRES